MTICTECNRKFSASEALCDDWKDPNKAYGCPGCGTFFVRDTNPRSRYSLIGGLLGGGIGTPAMFVLMRGFRTDDLVLIVMASIIIVAMLAAAFIFGRGASTFTQQSMQISPHRRNPGNDNSPGVEG